MKDNISYQQLVQALEYATKWLAVYREEINSLNVYPVPDGDTGTNMQLTLTSMTESLQKIDSFEPVKIAKAVAQGSLFGARGNSGVILSQFLKGFAEILALNEEINGFWLNKALKNAAKTAYEAVVVPVEGTILTVAKAISEANGATFIECLQKGLDEGWRALMKTPEMLPILKQAGVVDAGGQGLIRFFEGIMAYLQEKPLPEAPKIQSYAAESFANEEFGYCTEFLLENVDTSIEKIRQMVAPFGESLLVVEAEGFVKGHIHTDEPDVLLATVGSLGKMLVSKVEDMSKQHSEILSVNDRLKHGGENHAQKIGLVAVASGNGVIKTFRSFGARVINGGQTKNPSVNDLLAAINSIESPEIILLPNNKNVILAAKQASVISDKKVHVIETKTLGQGLSAALNFNEEADIEELIDKMNIAKQQVITFEITKASRDATIDGKNVKTGQFIGLKDNHLVESGSSGEDILFNMLKDNHKNQEILTVFTGLNIDQDNLDEFEEKINLEFPELSLEIYQGGPDLYDYLAILE